MKQRMKQIKVKLKNAMENRRTYPSLIFKNQYHKLWKIEEPNIRQIKKCYKADKLVL
jgi:hypothetical protein